MSDAVFETMNKTEKMRKLLERVKVKTETLEEVQAPENYYQVLHILYQLHNIKDILAKIERLNLDYAFEVCERKGEVK